MDETKTDAPQELNRTSKEIRIRILELLRDQLDEVIISGVELFQIPLADLVLLIILPGMEKKIPFPLPPPMLVIEKGAKKEDVPEIYVLAEHRRDAGEVLRSIYPDLIEDRSIRLYDAPPPRGFVNVSICTVSGYTQALLGEYVMPTMAPPNSANN